MNGIEIGSPQCEGVGGGGGQRVAEDRGFGIVIENGVDHAREKNVATTDGVTDGTGQMLGGDLATPGLTGVGENRAVRTEGEGNPFRAGGETGQDFGNHIHTGIHIEIRYLWFQRREGFSKIGFDEPEQEVGAEKGAQNGAGKVQDRASTVEMRLAAIYAIE